MYQKQENYVKFHPEERFLLDDSSIVLLGSSGSHSGGKQLLPCYAGTRKNMGSQAT